MSGIQLADMMEMYRSSLSPGYQGYISSKREYFELKSGKTEKLKPGRGQYFKHQIFSHRFLRLADRVLVASQTGTGKSCEVLGFCDYALRQHALSILDPDSADSMVSNIKKVIIFVTGDNHELEIKNQIICKCTDEKYEKMIIGKATGDHYSKKAVTQVINEANYEITTALLFVKQLVEKLTINRESAYDEYNDTIFYIDEMDFHTIERRIVDKIVADTFVDEGDNWNKERIWYELYTLFNSIKGSRVIGSTATPMVDDVNDIVGVLGLLLPKHMPLDIDLDGLDDMAREAFFPNVSRNQLMEMTQQEASTSFRGYIPPKMDLHTVPIEEFEPYLRGRILYTKNLDTGIDVEYQGEILELTDEDGNVVTTHQTVFPSVMSEYQSQLYEDADVMDSEYKEPKEGKRAQKESTLYQNAKSAANFVFKTKKKQRKKWGEIERLPINKNDIKELSSKLYALGVELKKLTDKDGNVFIYLDMVRGSGIDALEEGLTAMGYEKFEEKESIFKDETTDFSYCAESGKNRQERRTNFPAKKRFAVLTGDTTQAEAQAILNTMNAYENRHGKYIRILIGSRVAQVGLNINNISQVHIFSPPWNYKALYQAISRALRATSHIDLLAELPSGERIKVKIYQHVALLVDGSQTVDAGIYSNIEAKDIPIRRIMRFIKRCNMSCIVNKERNRDVGEDGSPACDYEKCDYDCFDPDPTTIDNSTYNISYSDTRISTITKYVISLFAIGSYYTISQLAEQITRKYKEYKDIQNDLKDWIIYSLENLIYRKMKIKDGFGFSCYVKEDKGVFYLDRGYNAKTDLLSSWYIDHLVTLEMVKLQTIANTLEESNINQEDLFKGKDVDKTLYTLSIDVQANLLEQAVIKSVENKENKTDKEILKHYASRLFTINLPKRDFKRLRDYRNKVKRGRKRKEITAEQAEQGQFNIKRIKVDEERKHLSWEEETEETPKIYLHQLYGNESNNTNFGNKSRELKATGRIRILNTGIHPLKWEDVVDEIEYTIYNIYLQVMISDRRAVFEKMGIFGFHNVKGDFMIAEAVETADKRKKKEGANCSSISAERLRNLASRMSNMPTPEGIEISKSKSKQKARAIELKIYEEDWSDQELKLNLIWGEYLNGYGMTKQKAKQEMCLRLEEFMEKDGRMI
jgi:hypothetical protein